MLGLKRSEKPLLEFCAQFEISQTKSYGKNRSHPVTKLSSSSERKKVKTLPERVGIVYSVKKEKAKKEWILPCKLMKS